MNKLPVRRGPRFAPGGVRERSMKKKYIVWLIVTVVIAVDLFVLLYPTVSGYINSQTQSRVVTRYLESVADMEEDNTQALWDAARAYNGRLLRKTNRLIFTPEETTEYKELLNTGNGVMGILSIDKINVKLPIYHGTDEGVLQVGLGHMQGTSLPVGGSGTHAFITGHRGLPSSTLLTDLNKMAAGDTFAVYVLGETLLYRVDRIQTVEPSDARVLDIDPDMDYCTLVTCTPYGINTHRLLVRGRRIDGEAVAERKTYYAGARQADKSMTVLLLLIPILPVLLIYIILKCRKIRRGGIVP